MLIICSEQGRSQLQQQSLTLLLRRARVGKALSIAGRASKEAIVINQWN
jgi:hypothetical protein